MDISDLFSPEGKKKLKKGQILIFNDKGKKTELKITKIRWGRIFADEIKTYSQEEIAALSSKELMELAKGGK